MEIWVLDKDYEPVNVVDSFTSFIWNDRYSEAGDFELYTSGTKQTVELFPKDFFLANKDSEKLMIIEDLRFESDSEEGNHATITGRSLESLLSRRIVWGQYNYEGSMQDAVKDMIDKAIINPEIPERKIPNFIFKESTDEYIVGLKIDAQYTGDNLYDIVVGLCEEHKIGFRIHLNDDKNLVFEFYRGTDRSYNQDDLPYVIFSDGFENIIESNFFSSKRDYKNVTYILGEGEGQDRTSAIVGEASGIERREYYTDARDINSEGLSYEQYIEKLKTRGQEQLNENKELNEFEGEVEASQTFKYNQDFFLGDIVQLVDDYGNESTSRVSEMVIAYDDEGFRIYPSFTIINDEDKTN